MKTRRFPRAGGKHHDQHQTEKAEKFHLKIIGPRTGL